MPILNVWGTQPAISLLKQIIDNGIIYDRDHLEDKKLIVDFTIIACQNPKTGSSKIDLRLTRHFTMISLHTAEKEIL